MNLTSRYGWCSSSRLQMFVWLISFPQEMYIFDDLDPLKTKGSKRFSSEVQFTESFIYIHDIHSSWTKISPRSDVLKRCNTILLIYTLVHLCDSVPWAFISSSKVTSSLEDLHTYVMWTREVWWIFFQSDFQNVSIFWGVKLAHVQLHGLIFHLQITFLKQVCFSQASAPQWYGILQTWNIWSQPLHLENFTFGFNDFQD